MKISPAVSFALFIFGLVLLNACSERDTGANSAPAAVNTSNSNSTVSGDDVQQLGKIINLPFEPGESTVWRESNLAQDFGNGTPSVNGKKLVAVLIFESDQTDEITKRAEGFKNSVPAEIDAENWFPEELVAQSQVSGAGTLKGNSYAANDFMKAPFIDGKLIRVIDTNYFVLELTTY